MGLLDRVKGIFNNKENQAQQEKETKALWESLGVNYSEITKQDEAKAPYVPPELPAGELVSFTENGILDATSRDAEEKFKHNLEILIDKTKKAGKVDKFMLIRDDDFFPKGWEWKVLSKNTNIEKTYTDLSFEIKKAQSQRLRGIEQKESSISGIRVPYRYSADLSNVDKDFAFVNMPTRFRSTKHFTVNTPLEVTGNYNSVESNRNFTIIDDMGNFLDSGYAYSVAYHDAYLDVSHESLPISQNAVVLINDEKYDEIMRDEKVASELAQRKVIRYKGEEYLAINMVLTEMGALPSQVGSRYAHYDDELRTIVDDSMKNLAKENGLLYDKSHGGDILKGTGHFTSYYDEKNEDFNIEMDKFWKYMEEKFPNYPNIRRAYPADVIDKVGLDELIFAIDEFNENAETKLEERAEAYNKDRASITPEIHDTFVQTVKSINEFYKADNTFGMPEAEEQIRQFFQADTVAEQLEASEHVQAFLQSRSKNKEESAIGSQESKTGQVNSKQVFVNALEHSRTETVQQARQIEENEKGLGLETPTSPEIK